MKYFNQLFIIAVIISISLLTGSLAGLWCNSIISLEVAIWAKALLGISVGGSAATAVLLIFFAVYEALKQSYDNAFLGVILYHSSAALCWGIGGAIAGGIVMLVV